MIGFARVKRAEMMRSNAKQKILAAGGVTMGWEKAGKIFEKNY